MMLYSFYYYYYFDRPFSPTFWQTFRKHFFRCFMGEMFRSWYKTLPFFSKSYMAKYHLKAVLTLTMMFRSFTCYLNGGYNL